MTPPTSTPGVLILIVSSDDLPVYKQMREMTPLYMDRFADHHRLQYFFVEFDESASNMRHEPHRLVFPGAESTVPGVYLKTIRAMEYVLDYYPDDSFDFVVRTNLSTFWNIPNLLRFLEDKPTTQFAGGFCNQGFISGVAIILSKDYCRLLVDHIHPEWAKHTDDILIAEVLWHYGARFHSIREFKLGYLRGEYYDPIPDNYMIIENHRRDLSKTSFSIIDDVLCFRVYTPSRADDAWCFKRLLAIVYGVKDDD